jgi:acyl carrier protein
MHDSLTVKVRAIVAGHFRIDPDRLKDELRLRDDLGADWLDRLELMIAVEDQLAGLEITDVVADQIETIGDLTRAIESLQKRRGALQ